MKRGCLRTAAWLLAAGAILIAALATTPADAGPPEKETPVVSVGGGSGILLTNTIVATARHVVPVNGSTVTVTTASGESVQGTATHYYVPVGTAEVPAGADFAVVKLDKPVSVYGDPKDYRMELYTWPTTGLIGNTTVRYGSAGFDEWGRAGVPIWSFEGKVSVAKVADSLVSVSGQLFTDLFSPFPAGDGSTHWWGYSGGPLVAFDQSQAKYIGANAVHYEYVGSPDTVPRWPNAMNGRRGVRYTDIATASGSSQTKLDWLQSFVASNDPKGRPIATTAVGSSFWSDRLAFQSGGAVSIGHTTTGPAASYDIAVERADKGDSVSCKSSAQPVAAGFYAGCTTRQILVDDLSVPGWKRWNVVISRAGQVVRKIPITIGATLATADYYYLQGQNLKIRYGGAVAGAPGDRIALVSTSGTVFASASTKGAKSGDVTIPLYDSTAARQPLEGVVTVKWLRKNGAGVEQSMAETAIELRPPVARLFRHDLLFDQRAGQVRPLDEIVVDVGGGAPGWKLVMKRKSDGERLWSSMLNTGYERVRISRNANPGAGTYEISLCHPDESVCPEFAELTVANARIEFEGAGPLSPTNPTTMWRFKFEGAANRGICDRLEVFELSKQNDLSLDFPYALLRTKFNAVSDIWCYLNTVEGQFAGTVPIDPTSAGNFVAYMTDDLLGQTSRNARHAAIAFTANSSGDLTNPIRYFEDGPVGSVEGYYRGETPLEFGWAGKAELGRVLKTLIIRHGDILDGIELVYDSGSAVQYGSRRQGRGDRIDLVAGEEIVEISGYLGQWFGARHILQITFRTNQNRSFGPYGSMANSTGRTAFRFTAPQGAGVVDFIGASVPLDYNVDRSIDRVISALGVIYRSP